MAHEYRPSSEYRPPPMSLAQRAALRAQQPRAVRQPRRRRVWPIITLLILLVAAIVAVGAFEYYYRDRVYPKVHLTTVDLQVGGMTQDQVIAALRPFSIEQNLRGIALIAKGRAPILVNGYKLGYRLDRGQTAWHAYTAGRDGNYLQRAREQVDLLRHGIDVDLVQSVDQGVLRRYLFGLAPIVDRPARPGAAGRRLDVVTAQREISRRLLGVVGAFKVNLPFIRVKALPVRHRATPAVQHKRKAKRHVKTA